MCSSVPFDDTVNTMGNAMNIRSSRMGVIAGGALAASLLLAGFGVGALQNTSVRAQPATAVAVVDFSRVLEALQEPKDRDADRRLRAEQLSKELEAERKRLEALEEEINKLPRNTPEWRDLVLRGLQDAAALKARQETHQAFLDQEKLDFLREIYGKVTDAVNRVAVRDGWELVLIDDRSITLPKAQSGRNAVDAAIASKRVIMAAERIELTNQVITMMNNEYQARRP